MPEAVGSSKPSKPSKPFLSDVKTLREGAPAPRGRRGDAAYGGDVKKTIAILQTVLATEIVCVLRYTQHSIVATGMSAEASRRSSPSMPARSRST